MKTKEQKNKENCTKRNLKNKASGITLIALVITIIVLLILAAVSLIALTGQDGIITKAGTAKENTEKAEIIEQIRLEIIGEQANNSGKISEEKLNEILEKYGTVSGEGENKVLTTNTKNKSYVIKVSDIYNGTTTSGGDTGEFKNVDTAKTNPAGAMPSGSNEIIEADANKGIVIKDQNDNEWVWVEVPKTIYTDPTYTVDNGGNSVTESTNTEGIKNILISYAKDYRKGSDTQDYNWTDEWYAMDGSTLVTASTEGLTDLQKALNNGCGLTYDQYKTNYENMLKSVYNNGGFWISRYEIGDSTATANNKTRTGGTTGVAVSQANQIPYNWVLCNDAQSLASGMNVGITNKTASLLFGIQWDLTCKFIEEKSDLEKTDINSNSTNWGNYSNKSLTLNRGKYNIKPTSTSSVWTPYTTPKENYVVDGKTSSNTSYNLLLTTGASDETRVMNIYDFAGNEQEYTLENTHNSDQPWAARGGYYKGGEESSPASYRFAVWRTASRFDFYCFRSSLF